MRRWPVRLLPSGEYAVRPRDRWDMDGPYEWLLPGEEQFKEVPPGTEALAAAYDEIMVALRAVVAGFN